MDLSGKVALITGGASGIGKKIAEVYLAAEAKVFLFDRNEELLRSVIPEFSRQWGQERVTGIAGNVIQADDVKEAVKQALAAFGRIDILVNNAGVGGAHWLWEMEEEEWDLIVNINLKGTFLFTREVVKVLLQEGSRGKIINMASVNSTVPTTGISAYCAAKAGVLMLTKVAALELGRYGITVNAIGPGSTLTPMTDVFFRLPWMEDGFVSRTPLGRYGRPEDIARVALFLASHLSDWITGHIIYADGGQSLMGLPGYMEGIERALKGG